MIFVTVGTQLPFDRLVKAIDDWASCNPAEPVFAQVGHSTYQPRIIKWARFLPKAENDQMCESATLVVAHAGMGSILTAMEHKKRILIVPRLATLGEHRNDHQVSTAKRMTGVSGVTVSHSVEELPSAITRALEAPPAEMSSSANIELLGNVSQWLRSIGGRNVR